MLKRLTVENYALIERLEMELDSSLNIITGETGAGKSILLGALGLLLGSKNDGAATRDNTKSCVLEGLFEIKELGLEPLFDECDWEWEEQITIRRVITASGKSRIFVGDIPASLNEVKILGRRLIDIHSQHQNQLLGDEEFRIDALDALYPSGELLEGYRQSYERLNTLRSQLHEAREAAASARRDEEWLSFQVEELTAAKLRRGEMEEREAELKMLENSEAIGEALQTLGESIDGDRDQTILSMLHLSERALRGVETSYPVAKEIAERVHSVIEELKDLSSTVVDCTERVESDPERLSRLSERVDTLYSLCHKHRAQSVDELIEMRDRYESQLASILNSDEDISRLTAMIDETETIVRDIATRITEARRSVAPTFGDRVSSTLHRLGMEHAHFAIEISPRGEFSASGADRVSFMFSSVEGRAMQSVERIASGGEVSRVMLSLKSMLAGCMSLPTIVFDEIDTGVSGRIADAMGDIIEELSESMQVIDITHLPQIASKGKSHFVVYKEAGHTNIARLDEEQREGHIAMMLSGESITSAALEQARILLRR